ncbi:MAG TPA: sodium/proline symporter [Bacillales bacterium]|nr:sodium/proline symporter [Bacillales bacterium]
MTIEIIATIVYMLVLVGIGVWSYNKAKNSLEDFLLGGRTVGPLVIALTLQATAMSAYIFQAIPGVGYSGGLSNIWYPFSSFFGAIIAFVLIAKRLRQFTSYSNSLTFTDFLSYRYYDGKKQPVRVISVIITVIFSLAYVGAQFVATGQMFHYFFGLDVRTGILIGAAVVFVYTLAGGFFSVIWTEFFQGFIMFAVLLIVPILGFFNTGGVGKTVNSLASQDPTLVSTPFHLISWLGIMFIGIAYIGQPQLGVRYMAMKNNPKVFRITLLTIGIWALISLYGAFVTGMQARVLHPGLDNPELSFFVIVQETLPHFVTGIVIAAVLAAIMSTAASLLLLGASGISEDIYHKIMNKSAPQKKLIGVTRLFILVITILSVFFAVFSQKVILTLVLFAFAGLSGAFAAPLVLGLFWKRTTKAGAIVGMISGMVTVIFWKLTGLSWHPFYEVIPAWAISFLLTWIVSLSTASPPERVKEILEKSKRRRAGAGESRKTM